MRGRTRGEPPRWRRILAGVRDRLRLRSRTAPSVADERGEGVENLRLHRLLAEHARDLIWMLEFPDRLVYVSPACETLLGWKPQEQLRRAGTTRMLTAESERHVGRVVARALAARAPAITYEAEHWRRDGTTVWCEVHQSITYDDAGRPISAVGITRDIGERRRLQEELTQSQKLDTIGTLAGGVAHDFNNFLTVIIGSLELAIEETRKDDETIPLLRDALDAAERSASLTAQLLAFSHNQPASIGPLDVEALVRRVETVIQRLVGERIALEIVVAGDLPRALANDNEVQQMVLNLAINARDAIRKDGAIRIEASSGLLDPEYASAHGVAPGRYVAIAVSDDGVGMDEAVRRRATDPFFTTKEKGRGTGLGLAMTQRILDRIGGHLTIASEPGAGTTVRMYLPAVAPEEGLEPAPTAIHAGSVLRGTETVLVVEDEDAVRAIASRILRHAGYAVFEAPTPARALALADDLAGEGRAPDLVLSDLVMPGMDGAELRERMRAAHPAARFVFMSGYTDHDVASKGSAPLPAPLVAKPFHATTLLEAVRDTLDAEAPDSDAG